jgi:hypothetical protein
MPILVADILRSAATVLNDYERDPGGQRFVRWTEDELIDWVNEGAAQIAIHRPAASAKTEVLELVEGPLQQIPETGLMLLDVVRNIPGRAIRRVDRSQLDDARPDWYAMKPADTVRHFCTDDRSPKSFYVYPPARAGVRVEVVYAETPAQVERAEDELQLDRAYAGALVSYVLYRALSKDSEYANGQVAAAHYQAFQAALAGQNAAQGGYSPKGALDETP